METSQLTHKALNFLDSQGVEIIIINARQRK